MIQKKEKPQFTFDPTRPPLYKVERLPNGFSIFREGFIDAQVILDETFQLSIRVKNSGGVYNHAKITPLMNFTALKESIIDEVIKLWMSVREQKLIAQGKTGNSCKTGKGLRLWFRGKITKSIGFYIYPEWKNLLEIANPTVSAIYKKFFIVRGPKASIPRVLQDPKVFENKGFVNDLLTYNSIHLCLDKSKVDNGELVFGVEDGRGRIERKLTNWRLAFSYLPKTYKALNLTLDNWPRGVPSGMALHLRKIHLKEPITDRVKLIAVLMASQHNSWKEDRIDHTDCIVRSSPKQIRKAFKIFKNNYEKQTKRKAPFTLRGHRGIEHLITHICDYDQPHEGEIVGLLEKAHRWHQDAELRRAAAEERRRIEWELNAPERERLAALNRIEWERRRAEEAIQREAEKKMSTKLPPIPLPENDNIRFLSTFEEVAKEGEEMGHCIASYARSAIKGECYLFHVEIDGEKASTMITKDGRLGQSYGPRNCVNKASKFGANVLGPWGKRLEQFLGEQQNGNELLSGNEQLRVLQEA